MQISVAEAASILATTPDRIHRWIKEGLPAHKVADVYQVNRAELLEWATAKGLAVAPTLFGRDESSEEAPLSVARCLQVGGIHHGLAGGAADAILRAVVERLPLPPSVDGGFLVDMLSARESLGSTSVGNGIAIPHVRSPIILDPDAEPILSLCFLREPADIPSIDGVPVRAIFTLVSPTIRIHLDMLSRLAFVLRDPRFRAAVTAQSPAAETLALAREIEAAGSPGGRSA